MCCPSEAARIMETVRFWPRRLRRRASIKRDERADAGPYRDILLVTRCSMPLSAASATSATAAHKIVPSTIL